MSRVVPRSLKSTLAVGVIGFMSIMLMASQAMAATVSQATANAIGGNLLTTGACSSTNDGTAAAPGTQTTSGLGCTASGGPSSNAGSALSAAVVVQTSNADPNGTSAACAGVTGPGGGAIQVGPSGPCTGVSSGTSSGVNVLSGVVTADAIYATCSAGPTGAPTGTASLVNAGLLGSGATSLLGALAGLGLGSLTGTTGTLAANPAPNTMINIGLGTTSLLSLTLNKQSTSNGTLTVTALSLSLLQGAVTTINGIPLLGPALLSLLGLTGGNLTTALNSGITVTIGTVTCGPNAAAPVSPALPSKALPIAGGVILLAGGAAFLGRKRLFAAFRG